MGSENASKSSHRVLTPGAKEITLLLLSGDEEVCGIETDVAPPCLTKWNKTVALSITICTKTALLIERKTERLTNGPCLHYISLASVTCSDRLPTPSQEIWIEM